jgi:hypothetical protein
VKVVLSKNAMYARPAANDIVAGLLKTSPLPQIDGVLAANDAMAFGAIEAFRRRCWRRPLWSMPATTRLTKFRPNGGLARPWTA